MNLQELIKALEENMHFQRECHHCGFIGTGYLHCLHDGIQKECLNCGEQMASVPKDCDCGFYVDASSEDILTHLKATAELVKDVEGMEKVSIYEGDFIRCSQRNAALEKYKKATE